MSEDPRKLIEKARALAEELRLHTGAHKWLDLCDVTLHLAQALEEELNAQQERLSG